MDKILDNLSKFETKIIFSDIFLENNKQIYENILENKKEFIFWFSSKKTENNDFSREWFYFDWEIETKKIKNIVSEFSWVLNLTNEKFYKKIEEICEKKWVWIEVFLKVDLWNSSWIKFDDLEKIINMISESENVSLVWFSVSSSDFENLEKFVNYKNKIAPNSFILTDFDEKNYIFALEKWVDILIF